MPGTQLDVVSRCVLFSPFSPCFRVFVGAKWEQIVRFGSRQPQMGHRRWPHFSTARGRAQLEVPGAVGADLEHLGTPGARWFGRVLLAAQLEVPGAVLRPA